MIFQYLQDKLKKDFSFNVSKDGNTENKIDTWDPENTDKKKTKEPAPVLNKFGFSSCTSPAS